MILPVCHVWLTRFDLFCLFIGSFDNSHLALIRTYNLIGDNFAFLFIVCFDSQILSKRKTGKRPLPGRVTLGRG